MFKNLTKTLKVTVKNMIRAVFWHVRIRIYRWPSDAGMEFGIIRSDLRCAVFPTPDSLDQTKILSPCVAQLRIKLNLSQDNNYSSGPL